MAFDILYIGKENKHIYKEAEQEYLKRISRYFKIKLTKLKPLKLSGSLSSKEVKEKEAEYLIKNIPKNCFVVLMDEKGKSMDSIKFSGFIQQMLNHNSGIVFIIGGAFGLSNSLKSKFKNHISLSTLTMPHHLARTVLLEQIYRACSILNNEPYHNS